MLFSEILTAVNSLTNRPDLTAMATLAIQRATIKLHSSDFYPRDLQLVQVDAGAASFNPQIDLAANCPRLRALHQVNQRNILTSGTFPTVERRYVKIDIAEALDEYNQQRQNVWYQIGTTLQVFSSTEERYFFLAYYAHPVVTPTDIGFASWVAVEMPYAIINEATANILRAVGHNELAAIYLQQAAEDLMLLKQNYLNPEAH